MWHCEIYRTTSISGTICVFFDSVIEEIRILFPKFEITSSFESFRNQRLDELDEIEEDCECDDFSECDDYGRLNDYEPPTYGRYAGSYAQDEMGYSDDDIDTIFDGDPLAYWNID